MTLRVLLVTGEYPPDEGGVADYTRCLAEALTEQGVKVVVGTGDHATAYAPGIQGARIAAATAPHPPTHSPTPASQERGRAHATGDEVVTGEADGGGISVDRCLGAWGWGALPRLARLGRDSRADVVHVQYQAAAFGMRPAIHVAPWWLSRGPGRASGMRTAVTYHDLKVPYLFPKAGRARRLAVLALARWADLTVTTNAEDHAVIEAWGRARRLTLVPIGSNVPDAPPPGYDRSRWRASAGIGPDTDVVAYFGFLNASKGGQVLLDAIAGLVDAGRDAQLVMIGGQVGASDPTNVGYLERFRADLAARGVAGRVRWTGHVPPAEVSAWLHASDVAALPYVDGASYRRGSLMAALTHGLPIVTTVPAPAPTAPGAPPPLVDGRSARLVPVGDPTALLTGLRQVLGDAALRARLAAGASHLAAAFAWTAIANRHIVAYREMVEPAD